MNTQTTIVSANTRISGNLQGDEDLRVLGRVDGNVQLTKTLYVEPEGVVVADIHVARAVISGTLVGNIVATDLIHIAEQGRVVGDITAPRVILVDGASFRGNVDMGDIDAVRPPSERKHIVAASAPEKTVKPVARRDSKPAPAPKPKRPPKVAKKRSAAKAPPAAAKKKSTTMSSRANAAALAVARAVKKDAAKAAAKKKRKPPTAAGKKSKARRK